MNARLALKNVAERTDRKTVRRILAVAFTCIVLSMVVGAVTNAISVVVSPTFFRTVFHLESVVVIQPAAIGAGIMIGLGYGVFFAIIFTSVVGFVTRGDFRSAQVLPLILRNSLLGPAGYACGGLGGVGIASLSPELFQRIFMGGGPREYSETIRFAWAGGGVWGVIGGGFLAVIFASVAFVDYWRNRNVKVAGGSARKTAHRLLAVALTCIVLSTAVGAATNAVSVTVSPTFFRTVFHLESVAPGAIHPAAIGAGIMIGLGYGVLFAVAFAGVVGIVTRGNFRLAQVLPSILVYSLLGPAGYVCGVLGGIGIAALSPELFQQVFMGGAPREYAEIIRFAWAGGGVWGVIGGGFLAVILASISFFDHWRNKPERGIRRVIADGFFAVISACITFVDYWRKTPEQRTTGSIEALGASATTTISTKTGALHKAVKQGDVALAQRCIDEGAHVNEEINYESALDVAVEAGELDMVRFLLASGARFEDNDFGRSQVQRARHLKHNDIADFLQGRLLTRVAAPSSARQDLP